MLARRAFLAMAAAGTTAAFSAESSPIGIGFLGASYSHAAGKLQVLQHSPDWRIVGACETDPKVQQSLQTRGVPLLSREKLLSHPEIQVIAVESPVPDHAADGKAALNAGKHLHLEKAPAANLPDLVEIVELAKRKQRLLQIGYMWRYNPGISKALEAAGRGWLGPVYLLRASMSNHLATERRAEWGQFPGGVMFELGCHVIDPMVRLMGRPTKVTPILHTESPLADKLRDNTVAVLEWNKAIGIIHSSTLQADSERFRAFEVYGSNGCAIVNPIEPPALMIDLAKPAGPYAAGRQTIPLPEYRRFVADFAALAAAVRGQQQLPITGEVDLAVEDALLRCSGMA